MTLALDARPATRPTLLPGLGGYALALAMVAAATLLAVAVAQQVSIPNLSLVFVLPVIMAAVAFGWGPALAAAVAGAGAYNFFLVPPLYTFRVADAENVWALGLLLVVAAIASAVAAQSRRRALAAQAAANQAGALQDLARALMAAADRDAAAGACAEALARLFHAPAVVLEERGRGRVEVVAGAGGAAPGEADLEAARWSLGSRLSTRGGAYPASEAAFDFWPVVTPRRQGAVLGVAISGGAEGRPPAPERLVEAVGAYLAVALDRDALAGEVLEARVERAGERLKSDLLAAVSHDLKTPLSTVLISLQSLRAFEHDAAARAELLALAETETARLARLVEDLLDSHRLESGAVQPRPAPCAAADLIAGALDQAAAALGGRRVETEGLAGAPALRVDVGLFESALAKVLENAGRYGPEGSRVLIRTGGGDGQGWVEVEDEGPGFTGAVEPLFGRFTRGVAGDGRPPGLGLGLSIARGFLTAMGGRIEASNRDDGHGARVRLIVPAA